MHLCKYIVFIKNVPCKGSYVDKKRGEGVSKKSMLGHLTKGRYHVKCP